MLKRTYVGVGIKSGYVKISESDEEEGADEDMDDDDADAEKEDDEEEEEERHQSSGIRGEGLDGQVGFCCKIEQIYNDR